MHVTLGWRSASRFEDKKEELPLVGLPEIQYICVWYDNIYDMFFHLQHICIKNKREHTHLGHLTGPSFTGYLWQLCLCVQCILFQLFYHTFDGFVSYSYWKHKGEPMFKWEEGGEIMGHTFGRVVTVCFVVIWNVYLWVMPVWCVLCCWCVLSRFVYKNWNKKIN